MSPARRTRRSHCPSCRSTDRRAVRASRRTAFTRSGVSFTDTATPTNFTCVPYFFAAASSVGSSSLQFGHHVAQNSMTTGVLPMYCARSDSLPSSVCTFADGAVLPTSMPRSCASRRARRRSVIAEHRGDRGSRDGSTSHMNQLSHFDEIVFRDPIITSAKTRFTHTIHIPARGSRAIAPDDSPTTTSSVHIPSENTNR